MANKSKKQQKKASKARHDKERREAKAAGARTSQAGARERQPVSAQDEVRNRGRNMLLVFVAIIVVYAIMRLAGCGA